MIKLKTPARCRISAGGGSFCGGSWYSALDDVERNLGLLSTLPVPSGRQLRVAKWIYAYRAPYTICYTKYDLRPDLSQASRHRYMATAAFAIARRLQFFAIAAVARYARRPVLDLIGGAALPRATALVRADLLLCSSKPIRAMTSGGTHIATTLAA